MLTTAMASFSSEALRAWRAGDEEDARERAALIAATETSPSACCVNMTPVLVVVGMHSAAIVPAANVFSWAAASRRPSA